MIRSFVILGIIALVSLVHATNFCSSGLCSNSTHIGCGNNGAYGPECPAERNTVEMTSELRDAILNSHNTKRNTLASGNVKNLKPAVRMATMRWDNELAKLAEFNVKRCIFDHDRCHNTDQFKNSGQNLAIQWGSGGRSSDTSIILDQINAWWSERKFTSMADINSFPSGSSEDIAHFTVMTADKNIALGCAAIKYRDIGRDNWDSLTLACNYATTNLIGLPVYIAGATASKCTSGRNPSYSGLCSPSERYNLN